MIYGQKISTKSIICCRAVFFRRKWKKYSSSWQSSDTKPNAKLVLVSREPLPYLDFKKPNKQNVSEINSCNKFSFSEFSVSKQLLTH